MPKEKRPVGRPRLSGEELAERKTVSRCVAFRKDTFEMLNELRGHESITSYVNKLVNDKYLSV